MSLSLTLKAMADNVSYLKVPVDGAFSVKDNPLAGASFSSPRPAAMHRAGAWRATAETESRAADRAGPVLLSWRGEVGRGEGRGELCRGSCAGAELTTCAVHRHVKRSCSGGGGFFGSRSTEPVIQRDSSSGC